MLNICTVKPLVEISIQSSHWNTVGFSLNRQCDKIVKTVFQLLGKFLSKHIEVSLLLADDANLQNLNTKYRNKHKTTNVLSFQFYQLDPEAILKVIRSKNNIFLGDIAISFERVLNESLEKKKVFIEYFSCLFIHGLLHLLGYNHLSDHDTQLMQSLENTVLQKVI